MLADRALAVSAISVAMLLSGCQGHSASSSSGSWSTQGKSTPRDTSNTGVGNSDSSSSTTRDEASILVPDLTGMSPDVAMQALQAVGLTMANGNIGPYCTVSSQSPSAGSLVPAGRGVLVETACTASDSGGGPAPITGAGTGDYGGTSGGDTGGYSGN